MPARGVGCKPKKDSFFQPDINMELLTLAHWISICVYNFFNKEILFKTYFSRGEVDHILFFQNMVKCLIGNEGWRRKNFILLTKFSIYGSVQPFHFLALPLNNPISCFSFLPQCSLSSSIPLHSLSLLSFL